MLPPAPTALPAAPLLAAGPPQLPTAERLPGQPDQGLVVTSDRLGSVRIDVSGSEDALAVNLSAAPAAAPLLAADAPRLAQELAAAGVALASYAVNGQRADAVPETGGFAGGNLSGGNGGAAGQPQQQRGQPADPRAAAAPRIAPPARLPLATDRFA